MAAVAGPPDFAGGAAVGFGGGVAQGLEGVAAAAEVLRAVRHQLQLAGLDLGAVLGARQLLEFRGEPVDAAVEALGLGMEHVDEAPEQALAFVGKLHSVGANAFGEDAEGLAHGRNGVVGIPDVAAVELVALGRRAVEGGLLTDGCGGGLFGEGVGVEGHDDLFEHLVEPCGACAPL